MMKNYLFFGGLFTLRYAYVDLDTGYSYVADSLFIRHKVRIKPQEHMVRDDTDYTLIFCRIKRKDRQEFEKALSEISGKMSLYGHNDYDQFCRQMMNELGLKEPAEEDPAFMAMTYTYPPLSKRIEMIEKITDKNVQAAGSKVKSE